MVSSAPSGRAAPPGRSGLHIQLVAASPDRLPVAAAPPGSRKYEFTWVKYCVIWRWPNASYSVSSISCGWMPNRAAASRSMVSVAVVPPICWSRGHVAQHRQRLQLLPGSSAPSCSARRGRRPAACTDTACAPAGRRRACPAPAACTACTPGTACDLRPQPGDHLHHAVTGRWSQGFRVMYIRPLLPCWPAGARTNLRGE